MRYHLMCISHCCIVYFKCQESCHGFHAGAGFDKNLFCSANDLLNLMIFQHFFETIRKYEV